jgi:TRAP-type C4-dicarboxylate transport system substrate-binding protein
MTNSKRPIATPDDLKGLKIRVTPDKIRLDTFKTLGALPVPMAFAELYSALQQGAVDGQENPLAIIFSSNFFEVQKYLSLTNHVWPATLVMAKGSGTRSARPTSRPSRKQPCVARQAAEDGGSQ